MFRQKLKHGVTHAIVHAIYLAGVAILFPVLVASYETGVFPWAVSRNAFYGSLMLIIIAALLLWRSHGKFGKTLRSLGWMKIIPGLIAVAFFVFGRDTIFGTARVNIAGFSVVEPFVRPLLTHSAPTLGIFAGAYILIGIAFVWIGHRLESLWA